TAGVATFKHLLVGRGAGPSNGRSVEQGERAPVRLFEWIRLHADAAGRDGGKEEQGSAQEKTPTARGQSTAASSRRGSAPARARQTQVPFRAARRARVEQDRARRCARRRSSREPPRPGHA